MSSEVSAPWRAPAAGRPDVPLPPDSMPLLRNRAMRKRWRYIGAYGEELMLCVGRVQVGPVWQIFWAVWDREQRRLHERTRLRPLGGGDEVVLEGETVRISDGEVRAELQVGLGGHETVEVICPSGERSWAWTRKSADVPVSGFVEIGGRRVELECRGVEDLSAGYHARHTSWYWSAGVGTAVDGRSVGWNLATGINDPPTSSERGIWVDGVVSEPGPVEFEDLDGIRLDDGSRLAFHQESVRSRSDNTLVFRSEYTQPFGTFSGTLGGLELREGFGVMERHVAVW